MENNVGFSPTTQTYFKPTFSEIKFGRMRFLIAERPTVYTMDNFIKELERRKAKKLVRVCQPNYSRERLQNHGIEVLDWEFSDGHPPPEEIIEKWLKLVKDYFWIASGSFKLTTPEKIVVLSHNEEIARKKSKSTTYPNEKAIAIHCVSGLGRAPVLVGLALLEAGMCCEDVIYLIRTNRRGALNEKQLEFLKSYRATGKLRKLRQVCEKSEISSKTQKLCSIM